MQRELERIDRQIKRLVIAPGSKRSRICHSGVKPDSIRCPALDASFVLSLPNSL
jgi:hypothetical protein